MIYKNYGTTGKKISAIAFGGMRFLPDEYQKDIKICAELVLEAHSKGITYFDTAPFYCHDKSEAIFGEAFKQMKYGEFYVSTKCGLGGAAGRTADDARRFIEQSLTRLNVPKITFYYMWCAKTLEEYHRMIAPGGIYDGILKAKEEGLIEHICCSTHCNGDEIAEIAKDERVEGIMLGYNAINFAYRRKGVAACGTANKGVVVMNPLGGGIIPKYPDRFSFLTEGTNDKIAVSALKFLLAHNEISAALPGFSNSAEIDDALLAVNNLPTVNDEYLNNLSKKVGEELNTLCTGCTYCDECPVDVPVPKLIEAYNMAILTNGDMSEVAKQLRNHWGVPADAANACIECGKCEVLCTQKLPIVERLKAIGSYKSE